MEITRQIVERFQLTTMMITHNMQQALTTGTRTIMLDGGEILFDMDSEMRKDLTVDRLLDMYSEKKKAQFSNDRILLA